MWRLKLGGNGGVILLKKTSKMGGWRRAVSAAYD